RGLTGRSTDRGFSLKRLGPGAPFLWGGLQARTAARPDRCRPPKTGAPRRPPSGANPFSPTERPTHAVPLLVRIPDTPPRPHPAPTPAQPGPGQAPGNPPVAPRTVRRAYLAQFRPPGQLPGRVDALLRGRRRLRPRRQARPGDGEL